MKCVHWLLLAAVLSSGQANEAATSAASILELERILLATPLLQGGRRLLSDDIFEDHAARYLVNAPDKTEEATALFKLYKKLYPKHVAAWGATETKQFAYFEDKVFPRIEDKADKLLAASSSGADDSSSPVGGEESGTTQEDKTPTDSTSATTSGKHDGASDDDSTTTSDETSTNGDGGGRDGTSTSGRGGTSTSGRGGTSGSGGRSDGGRGGASNDGHGGTSRGGGSPASGGAGGSPASGGAGGSPASGGAGGSPASDGAGGSPASGGAGGSPASGGAGGSPASGGAGGSPASGGAGGSPASGGAGGSPASGGAGGSPASGGAGGSPASGGAGGSPASGGAGGSPASSGAASSGTLTATSKSPTSTASGSSFWSTTYNPKLSSNVNSLSPQTSTLETVVSSAAGSDSSTSAVSQYTSPTVISGYTSPTRRFLTSGDADTSNVDVLFCDIEGNAIWKWSAEDVPDATVTNSSSSYTEIDVTVDGVCSATTTLTVSAYQTGCSLQNHPEGCEDVYYKGCGGITVSPTSNRIVIARTGGRTLGVLNYKSVDGACQGQVVDAITTYRGRKFNSPTYAEYANNGNLYFTDSPFGLATSDADFDGDTLDKSPLREIPFNGVYMLRNGTDASVELVDCDMTRPNKIAFSPTQDIMYITNSQRGNSYVKRYVLAENGTMRSSSVFFNFTAHPELKTDAGYAKGIKVDDNGYVYVVCYKGVYIFSPEAELAGAIMSSEELDSVSMGLGRLFISGAFGLVAQTSGVPSQTLPRAHVTCPAS
ncbi:hypothetical protein PsorP6_016228 [Peronosclerospora sorghi]|uniref:Uncharacterized protein n=1 Tax=Peronosclerospora sorghi TaxID=230839 RepID=A0ACC0VKH9_9STRA|nr:hypothetical protein PsorP6_016228 [Peronosclerospora sorghi]